MPPDVIDYASDRTRLRWFAWPTVLSGALLAHFLVSDGFWLLCLVGIVRNPSMRDAFVRFVAQSAPAFVLCAVSAIVFARALRGRPHARLAALFVAVAAALLFAVDVSFGRWQIEIGVASQEYWDSGGKEHYYFTWWWYNDRWFR